MALIALCCHDTEENGRTEYTEKTLASLSTSLTWNAFTKHRLFIIDNGSCKATKKVIDRWKGAFDNCTIITLPENIGTAGAINLAWKERKQGEHCLKLDNDVIINDENWLEQMEEVVNKDSSIGQVGLKRVDCRENPESLDPFYKSKLRFLNKSLGEPWIVVEEASHIMGTCILHSSKLIDKIGYLYQPKVYGFDDSLASFRCKLAGFKSVFLPHIRIEHIDRGDTPYQKEKEKIASDSWKEYHEKIAEYKANPASIYYNPYE